MVNWNDGLEEKAIEEMERAADLTEIDQEEGHAEADKVLTDLLNTLGFERLVKLYESIPKWYA